MPHQDKTRTERVSSKQLLLLDSADRNQNSQPLAPGLFAPNALPSWNSFRLQKAQPLQQAYARRLEVTEIRLPWFIPNITEYNNTLVCGIFGGAFVVTLDPKFYTPTDLVNAINAQLATGVGANPPVLSYDSASMRYTLTNPALGNNFFFGNASLPIPDQISFQTFESSASLAKTLGITWQQYQLGLLPPGTSMTFSPTLSQYTSYVDIVSDKLMTYTDVRDATSFIKGKEAILCRVYANDEISIPNPAQGVAITCAPFNIHRQFKTPKVIKWTPEASIDWVDISVYDEWGNLVYIPKAPIRSDTPLVVRDLEYPDFQITMTASED